MNECVSVCSQCPVIDKRPIQGIPVFQRIGSDPLPGLADIELIWIYSYTILGLDGYTGYTILI